MYRINKRNTILLLTFWTYSKETGNFLSHAHACFGRLRSLQSAVKQDFMYGLLKTKNMQRWRQVARPEAILCRNMWSEKRFFATNRTQIRPEFFTNQRWSFMRQYVSFLSKFYAFRTSPCLHSLPDKKEKL